MSVICEAIELRSANPRETLAGWAANQNVRTAPSGEPIQVELIFDIALLPREHNGRRGRLQARDVFGVRARRSFIDIHSAENIATRRLEPQAEPTCPAEQIDYTEAP